MKMKPVVDGLEAQDAEVTIVHTGQHYDTMMSNVFFDDINLRQPDYNLGIGSGSHSQQVADVMSASEPLFEQLNPDFVVVAGDVNSTLACAIVAAKLGILVGHVEAGLRSRDWSMPEEINRVVTDTVSDLLFAPSDDAVQNLRSEGVHPDRIVLSGNVMIDTLLCNLERAKARPVIENLGLTPGSYGLVTLHRPSNVDDSQVLGRLMDVLALAAERLPLVFPVHPRTASQLVGQKLSNKIIFIEPQGYLDFLALEAAAQVVFTDSGGVQEETTALGVACLTLRENTERPITIIEGTNQLVGNDPVRVLNALDKVLNRKFETKRPALWDGQAGRRIAESIIKTVKAGKVRRPTDS